MQLARDPRLLLGRRPPHVRLVLGLEPSRSLAPRTHVVAQQPRGAEQRVDPQQLPEPERVDREHEGHEHGGRARGRVQGARPPDVRRHAVERHERTREHEGVVDVGGGERRGERDGEDGERPPAPEHDRQRGEQDEEHEPERDRRLLGWRADVVDQDGVGIRRIAMQHDARAVEPGCAVGGGRRRRPRAAAPQLDGRGQLPRRPAGLAVAEHDDPRVPDVAGLAVGGWRVDRPVDQRRGRFLHRLAGLDAGERHQRDRDREQGVDDERGRSPTSHRSNPTPERLVRKDEAARSQGGWISASEALPPRAAGRCCPRRSRPHPRSRAATPSPDGPASAGRCRRTASRARKRVRLRSRDLVHVRDPLLACSTDSSSVALHPCALDLGERCARRSPGGARTARASRRRTRCR